MINSPPRHPPKQLRDDEKEKESKSKSKNSKQPASQQYTCQYKIQYMIPNTFITNKESIAQEDSLRFIYLISVFGIEIGQNLKFQKGNT